MNTFCYHHLSRLRNSYVLRSFAERHFPTNYFRFSFRIAIITLITIKSRSFSAKKFQFINSGLGPRPVLVII